MVLRSFGGSFGGLAEISHVDKALLFEHLPGLCRFVVECDIGPDGLDEFNLLFRAGRSDHLETLCLRNLHDGTTAWSADIGAW